MSAFALLALGLTALAAPVSIWQSPSPVTITLVRWPFT